MINLPFNIDLSNKVAVITGANSIICGTLAKALAASGARVALIDFNIENAERYAKEINHEGFIAKAFKVNLINKTDVENLSKKITKDLGSCDILINGAGGNNPNASTTFEHYLDGDLEKDIISFFNLDPDSIELVFNLNFLSTLIPSQVFAKHMINKPGCSIVNISSINAFSPFTKIPAYSAAKAGIDNFTKWLAVHFSKTSIRVNSIATGFFITPQNENILFDSEGNPTPRGTKILMNTPMERFGIDEELIGSLLFLVNEKSSSYITGIVIPVDGGFSAYSGV